ncbi:hypothetical protein QFZ79_001126 [Arthrobacter sp. V4I6]|nr:hypothetical protein [Arthrobacter sp. V1I7]MDQ0853015.1 hypothetical protein [Arthrobacter sp. V4I6]
MLEHCDAAGSSHPPVKGFLSLEAEIDAVLGAGAGTGITVNWARSVIEQRDVAAPLRHVKLALEAGVLAGAVLSGCAPVATEFGAAWDDVHLPPGSQWQERVAVVALSLAAAQTAGWLSR